MLIVKSKINLLIGIHSHVRYHIILLLPVSALRIPTSSMK